jgi:TetR/AcrR family transcriptional regulator, transcriptional repressor for nem operon
MKVTRKRANLNRELIVGTASRLFRERGFDAVGIDEIMHAAGLTHGGFYNHFRSKDELAVEAARHAFASSEQKAWTSFKDMAGAYLTSAHRNDRAGGCAIAALACDIARQKGGVRKQLTAHLRAQIEWIAGLLGGRKTTARRRECAIKALSELVGALVLARAVDDPKFSEEILAAVRKTRGEFK